MVSNHRFANPWAGPAIRGNAASGEPLFVVRGRPVSALFDHDQARGPNWLGTGWESWIVPDRGNPIRFTNHSCDPNVIVSEGLVVKAIRDIPSGDEILLDYATTEIDPFWQLHCCCRSPRCRGQVSSFLFLPAALRVRYEPDLPAAFMEAARRRRPRHDLADLRKWPAMLSRCCQIKCAQTLLKLTL